MIEENRNKVRDYVKENLFERLVFVWNKHALEQGEVVHKDFLKNCRPVVANGELVDATDNDAETYMNYLWAVLVKDNSYREWLCQKRSSRYQAMQDKFASECCTECDNLCGRVVVCP